MADIPGIIEGAQQGLGLGHQFLRHVERCRLLVHVVDVSGSEGRDPKKDFQIINNEIKTFNQELAKCPMIVVANKCDLATDSQIDDFKNYIKSLGYPFFAIMAPIKYGTDELLDAISETLSKLPDIKIFEPEEELPSEKSSYGKESTDKTFKIKNENGIFVVESTWLEKLIQSINFDDYDSLQYFQKILTSSGINDALIENGAKDGDTVKIDDLEFDFVE